MKKHKPCPFCGLDNLAPQEYDCVYLIRCNDCFAEGPQVLASDYPDEHTAIAAAYALWDRRISVNESPLGAGVVAEAKETMIMTCKDDLMIIVDAADTLAALKASGKTYSFANFVDEDEAVEIREALRRLGFSGGAICTWEELPDDGVWHTGCDNVTSDDLPEVNYYNYCPFCGRKIRVK